MESAWVWDGDRPSLDLVNTFRDRKDGGRELLAEPADLREWLELAGFAGFGGRDTPTITDQEVERARALREAISAAVEAVVRGSRIRPTDIAEINQWAAESEPVRRRLDQPRGQEPIARHQAPTDPFRAALTTVAIDAIDLLGTSERETLRICAAHDCGLRFSDRSQAGRRQWCSMARCGNRAKARAHRQRQRT